jgi:hypothetical protein
VVNLTDLDRVLMDHAARAARADREGWLRDVSAPTGGSRTHELATVVGMMRRRLGETLVRAGERLRGTPAGHAANPAAAPRYTIDTVR